jgi:voltage-gated potassium channel
MALRGRVSSLWAMTPNNTNPPPSSWREHIREIIFEADTPLGKAFDVSLIVAIVLSVAVVILESVEGIRAEYGQFLRIAEWTFTIFFTIEYLLRLICVASAWRYAISFFGVVDLLATLPTWISLFVPGSQSLLVIRSLRLLRVFRVLKLSHFLGEFDVLATAIRSSARKVIIFIGTVLILVVIIGTAMYLIEGEENVFTSIPVAMYWAVVTMTTVGYGDITPHTVAGQFLASITMITGYGIIAVPTGIFTAEIFQVARGSITTRHCSHCHTEGHQ